MSKQAPTTRAQLDSVREEPSWQPWGYSNSLFPRDACQRHTAYNGETPAKNMELVPTSKALRQLKSCTRMLAYVRQVRLRSRRRIGRVLGLLRRPSSPGRSFQPCWLPSTRSGPRGCTGWGPRSGLRGLSCVSGSELDSSLSTLGRRQAISQASRPWRWVMKHSLESSCVEIVYCGGSPGRLE